jgi:hypothetical protein
MRSIERLLQRCLNNIQRWADENGFQFSKTKTVCMHFCQQRALHPDPELKLNGVPIPVVDEVKFLGLIFDRKLTFAFAHSVLETMMHESAEFVASGGAHGLGCRQCDSPEVISVARPVQAGLWMRGLRVSAALAAADTGPRAERCIAYVSGSVSDVAHI